MQRGRKSAAELSIAPPTGIPNRPDPPEAFTEAQAALWADIVAEKPAGWFDAATVPLLASYCRGVVFVQELAAEIAALGKKCLRHPDKLRRLEKLNNLLDKQEKRLVTLATKLRLAQQSRYDKAAAYTAARDAAKPKLWEVSGG
jgi:hypothetical protein